ncbi:hypothetical protein [Scytonema tolypothrichoides]|uniref:Proline/alanine-rich repeat-containing protein n=2 Tax=Nostocales TaxID=1161 RepID=A0ABW8WIY9_9CYAN
MRFNKAGVVIAIPVVAGTLSLIFLNQVNAAHPSYRVAQAAQQPNQQPEGQRRPPRPDWKAAAAKLGVTEQQLKDALGVPANPPSQADPNQRPPRPDWKAAAAKLGVTEQQLKDALGVRPHPRPNLKAASAKLGVTEQQLKDALGVPANPPDRAAPNQRPPRPDLKAVAAKLGVTEQQLKDALGVPPHPRGEGDRPEPPANK